MAAKRKERRRVDPSDPFRYVRKSGERADDNIDRLMRGNRKWARY